MSSSQLRCHPHSSDVILTAQISAQLRLSSQIRYPHSSDILTAQVSSSQLRCHPHSLGVILTAQVSSSQFKCHPHSADVILIAQVSSSQLRYPHSSSVSPDSKLRSPPQITLSLLYGATLT
ncbi:hypothetical protein TNCT_680931 [Trichonephila clavata]|uniref:Uncharacterized protein n=1 Tax=Trichonephila clavata TaxID=2740835 RepID=A0A8X6FWD9_TRICU|nr:hypothetical protein TNCT_680931 [Trichonephila clavata]